MPQSGDPGSLTRTCPQTQQRSVIARKTTARSKERDIVPDSWPTLPEANGSSKTGRLRNHLGPDEPRTCEGLASCSELVRTLELSEDMKGHRGRGGGFSLFMGHLGVSEAPGVARTF